MRASTAPQLHALELQILPACFEVSPWFMKQAVRCGNAAHCGDTGP